MHIDTLKSEFVNKYMELREERLPPGKVNTRSKPAMVRAGLEKGLSLVFSPSAYPFFSLPVLGNSKDGFYEEMKKHSLSEIEQLFFASESGKPEFFAAFKSMMLSETQQLQIYAATALMLKDSNEPQAKEFATAVLNDITSWSGPLLGSLFVNLRQFYNWVILPLKNDIINDEEAERYMVNSKIVITMEDTLEEAQNKLDLLYAQIQQLASEGADPKDFPLFSITNNLQSFLGGGASAVEAEA